MGVYIRVAKEDDAPEMLEIYGPVVRDTAISFETHPPNTEEFCRRIRASLEQRLWLVFE